MKPSAIILQADRSYVITDLMNRVFGPLKFLRKEVIVMRNEKVAVFENSDHHQVRFNLKKISDIKEF